jgi:hypothetical protein
VIIPLSSETGQDGIEEQIMVYIEIPDRIQVKEETKLLVEIDQILNPDSNTSFDLFNRYYVNLESRIELPGIHVNPSGLISKNLIEKKKIEFEWNLKPNTNDVVDGTYWLYVNLLPKNNTDAKIHKVLLAKQFKIDVYSIFGLSSNWIKCISSILLLMNVIILFVKRKDLIKI